MEMLALKILVGFIVGILIGMSGVGGGVLLLPVLIFGLRVPAITAVGSDALFNFFTKVPASIMHLKRARSGAMSSSRSHWVAFQDQSVV